MTTVGTDRERALGVNVVSQLLLIAPVCIDDPDVKITAGARVINYLAVGRPNCAQASIILARSKLPRVVPRSVGRNEDVCSPVIQHGNQGARICRQADDAVSAQAIV